MYGQHDSNSSSHASLALLRPVAPSPVTGKPRGKHTHTHRRAHAPTWWCTLTPPTTRHKLIKGSLYIWFSKLPLLMVFHSLKICIFNLRYFFYVNVHIEIAIGIIFTMTQSNKSRPHKITGLPSCWFCFAGMVNRAETPRSASLVTLALCTKTIYQDYNIIWKCLCIPFMQLVINLTSGSLPTYKLKLRGMVALVHVETIGLGQIFIEDCKPFFFL